MTMGWGNHHASYDEPINPVADSQMRREQAEYQARRNEMLARREAAEIARSPWLYNPRTFDRRWWVGRRVI